MKERLCALLTVKFFQAPGKAQLNTAGGSFLEISAVHFSTIMPEMCISERNFLAFQGNLVLRLQSQAEHTKLLTFYIKIDYFR